jgi:Zn finger protein HypA/HybF involved in hydrogenase expression
MQALEALTYCEALNRDVEQQKTQAITALRKALEQPEQECWCHKCNENRLVNNIPFSATRMILCPTCGNKRCPKASDHRLDCTDSNEPNQPGSLYTTPPAAKRQWVGLTDEEVKHEWEVWRVSLPRYIGFAQGIEAKLKERNNG